LVTFWGLIQELGLGHRGNKKYNQSSNKKIMGRGIPKVRELRREGRWGDDP
jgi:hypothetical protein